MGIGARKPVQLVEVLNTVKADGSNTVSYGIPIGTWAEISNPSGFRQYLNGQTQAGQTKDFLIRYKFTGQPTSSWIIRYAGKDWTIQTRIAINEKAFYWRITATSKSDV